jgi:hypothetical protein
MEKLLVSFTPLQVAFLRATARDLEIPVSELVRRIIDDYRLNYRQTAA